MSTPSRRTFSRDTLSYVGGWAMMIYQIHFADPADFNLWVFLTGAALAGVPGIGAVLAARASAVTGLPPSEPAVPPSSRPPSSSSNASSAGEPG